MAIWTVLIAATIYAAYSWNFKFNVASLEIPPEFFWLLGIGAVSLVGSPLAKNAKFSLKIDEKEKSDAEVEPDADGRGGVAITGVIHSNRHVKDAKFIDIFKGEEVGNSAHVDIGKVQMAVFTVIATVIYGLMIANAFAQTAGDIKELPTLSQSFIYILLISHAGYLAHKAVPHSKTKYTDAQRPPQAAYDRGESDGR